MSYSTKFRLATAMLGIAVACALYGFSRMQAEALADNISTFSLVLLFGGSAVGVTAGILQMYFKSRIKHSKSTEQMKVETLAEAGKKKTEKSK